MLITEQYAEKISGVISCYGRIVIQGTIPGFCYAQGMTSFLNTHNIRIFGYPHFAEPLRDELRNNAEQIAKENGLEIEGTGSGNWRGSAVMTCPSFGSLSLQHKDTGTFWVIRIVLNNYTLRDPGYNRVVAK